MENQNRSWFNNTILFLGSLIIFVFILSIIGSALKWDGTYFVENSITKVLESNYVVVESLFSREGIRYIVGNAVSNFMNFTPLIMFLFIMIGVGFAERTGLFNSIFSIFGKKINKFWLTFLVVLFSIISTIIGDVGFVIVIPLAAILFITNGRNPLVGIIASFVGMTAGYSVNLFVTQMDYILLESTQIGAKIIDSNYEVAIIGNVFFAAISTILLAFLITYITEKQIIKKVAKYKKEDLIDDVVIGKKEKRGLFLAIIAFVLMILTFVYILLPIGTPLSGILLDYDQTELYARIYSQNSYVIQGLSFMLFLSLLICGWLYGIGARTIKTKNQFSNYLYNSLNNVGGVLVLFFFASQLIALFKKTNLGTVFTIWTGNILNDLNFSSIPLIVLFLVLIAILNLFQTSTQLKWSILSPVVIPLFMRANITPEFTQAIFRAGDSVTNIVTPFFPYFVVFIGMLQLYHKQDEIVGIKETYKLLLPYTFFVFAFWLIMLICWYIINLPIGISVYPII